MNSTKYNLRLTDKFKKKYSLLDSTLKKIIASKLKLLQNNFNHNSLYTKKIKGSENLWELRINCNFRAVFEIDGNTLILLNIGPHDILDKKKYKDLE